MNALELMQGRQAPLRMVIFDCDGVLLDSESLSNRVVAAEITALGWKLTAAEAERLFIGASLPTIRTRLEARLGRPLPAGWEDHLIARLSETMARECRPIPGALESLEATTALGLAWCVASNSSHREMAAKFAASGMTEMVAGRLYSFEDVAHGKPAPDLFLHAAAVAGVAPAHCLVVEDSPLGARGARAAGMDCLGFAATTDAEALRAVGAAPFGSMAEVPHLLALGVRKAA